MHAARRLFALSGFHRTSISDLAREADVSVGAIYRFFSSKDEIIQAIVVADTEHLLKQAEAVIEQLLSGTIDVQQAIESLIRLHFAENDEALSHEILAEGHRNEAVGATVMEFCEKYRDALKGLATLMQPNLSTVDLDAASHLLLGCLFGLSHRRLTHPPLDETDTIRVSAQLILNMFKRNEAPPSACNQGNSPSRI